MEETASEAERRSRPSGTDFAAALGRARRDAGLTRAELAASAKLDLSVLSRLESGRYQHRLKSAAVERLTAALSCGDALYVAGGFLSPGFQELFADASLQPVLTDAAAVKPALRRVRLMQIAQEVTEAAQTVAGRQVDVARLWRAAQREAGQDPGAPPHRWLGTHPSTVAGQRFQMAHCAAHVLLTTECGLPRLTAAEGEASELASLLLAPPASLRTAVRVAFQAEVAAWDADTGGLVAAVAEFLMVPGWVAACRLADFGDLYLFLGSDDDSKEKA